MTAYHEAGHAVAAFVFGHELWSVSIRPDRKTHGRTLSKDPYYTDADGVIHLSLAAAEEIAVVLYAGLAAERLFNAEAPDAGSGRDYAEAAELIERIAESDSESLAGRLQEHASELMRKHWSAVQLVAAQLAEHEELDDTEIEQLVLIAREDPTGSWADLERYRALRTIAKGKA